MASGVGAFVGAGVLGGVGVWMSVVPCRTGGLECLGWAIAGVFVLLGGSAIGGTVGAYVALRVRRLERAGATAGLAVAVIAACWTCLFLGGDRLDPVVGIALVASVPVLAPVAARALLFWLVRGRASKSDGSSDIVVARPPTRPPTRP